MAKASDEEDRKKAEEERARRQARERREQEEARRRQQVKYGPRSKRSICVLIINAGACRNRAAEGRNLSQMWIQNMKCRHHTCTCQR